MRSERVAACGRECGCPSPPARTWPPALSLAATCHHKRICQSALDTHVVVLSTVHRYLEEAYRWNPVSTLAAVSASAGYRNAAPGRQLPPVTKYDVVFCFVR